MNPDYVSNLAVTFKTAQENYQVLEFKGDFDKAGLEEFRSKIDLLVQNLKQQYLVFDFSGLNYINSESIGYLMSLNLALNNAGKKLIFVGVQPNVKDVLNMIGVMQVVNGYANLSDFILALKG